MNTTTSAATMPGLIRQVIRRELRLGLKPAYRICLDIEPGVDAEGRAYCWGVYDHDVGVLRPEFNNGIEGYIEGVGVRVGRESNGKIPKKLCVHMDCGDRTYRISCGLMTTFSRSLINSLVALTPEQAAEPVMISVRNGDHEKIVLPRLTIPSLGRDGWVGPKYEHIAADDVGTMRQVYRELVGGEGFENGGLLPQVSFGERDV